MATRHQELAIHLGKYLVGGGAYFWTGYATFALLYSVADLPWIWAKITGDVFGRICEYSIQRFWTFRATASSDGRHLRRYSGLVIINTAIDYTIVGGINHLGVSPYIGIVVSASFFTIWNYIWYRLWVFRRSSGA